ncbi:MAG: TraB/GumN family protein [Oscillospiraceae bacterium]|nr:TraB/GumN family protein [Oscillospiraceae bacterium]
MKWKHNLLALLTAALLILPLLGGCQNQDNIASAPSPEPSPGVTDTPEDTPITSVTSADITPLMWRVTSPEGQAMYLFGSIHAGEASIYPLPDFIMDAFYRSDYLAVEADLYAFENDMGAILAIHAMQTYQEGRTIADDIGEALHERLIAILADFGVPNVMLDMLNTLKPFMWHSTLASVAVEQAGMSAEYGVDMHFIQAAMARDMDILEVESMGMQLEMLMGLSMPAQIVMLESAAYVEEGAMMLVEMYEMWQQGDEEGFLTLFYAEYEDAPAELYEEIWDALFIQRDIGMTQVARQYMADGKNVFFVVGLGHLIGEDSVVYLLKNYGYTVERVLP